MHCAHVQCVSLTHTSSINGRAGMLSCNRLIIHTPTLPSCLGPHTGLPSGQRSVRSWTRCQLARLLLMLAAAMESTLAYGVTWLCWAATEVQVWHGAERAMCHVFVHAMCMCVSVICADFKCHTCTCACAFCLTRVHADFACASMHGLTHRVCRPP